MGLPSAREDASETESLSEDAVGERILACALVARSARAVASMARGEGERGERRGVSEPLPSGTSYIDGGHCRGKRRVA